MKKYLFGLGAMLVGAGLMFALMHGEVSAEGEADRCDYLDIPTYRHTGEKHNYDTYFLYCKFRDLTCVKQQSEGISCMKTKGGLFKWNKILTMGY